MSEEEIEALDEIVESRGDGTTRSDIVREAVRQYLARELGGTHA